MENKTFYNEILTEHNLHPYHKHKLEDANLVLEGRTWIFKEYSAKYETAGDDLFAIICTTKDSANQKGVKSENYLIENDDGTVVYFESREKGAKAGITVKSIKPYIKIFKDKELAAK